MRKWLASVATTDVETVGLFVGVARQTIQQCGRNADEMRGRNKKVIILGLLGTGPAKTKQNSSSPNTRFCMLKRFGCSNFRFEKSGCLMKFRCQIFRSQTFAR